MCSLEQNFIFLRLQKITFIFERNILYVNAVNISFRYSFRLLRGRRQNKIFLSIRIKRQIKYLYALYILHTLLHYIYILTSGLFHTVRWTEPLLTVAWPTARGHDGPILRIAGVSPAMLGACKSLGRYHLTLIGPNPETRLPPRALLHKHAPLLFSIFTLLQYA